MDLQNIRKMIIAHASELSGTMIRDISDDTVLDHLAMDSLTSLCFIGAIEDSANIEITCSERVSMETIGDAINLVSHRILAIAA